MKSEDLQSPLLKQGHKLLLELIYKALACLKQASIVHKPIPFWLIFQNKLRFMMDDPNITMEEYIKIQAEKLKGMVGHLIGKLLHTIWVYHPENRDIYGLGTRRWGQTLADKMRIVYIGAEGQVLFASHAWRRLFEIRAPLVPEFILEFFNTCRISDTELELDVANTLCFQLGIARRRMTWREFILALGLHTTEEMVEVGFEAYWLGSARAIPNKGILGIIRLRFHLIGTF
ncbi:hypothetical protein Tco_0595844 [Tanacetum coccineum]